MQSNLVSTPEIWTCYCSYFVSKPELLHSVSELVDTICRDSTDTQYIMIIQKKYLKISKMVNLQPS